MKSKNNYHAREQRALKGLRIIVNLVVMAIIIYSAYHLINNLMATNILPNLYLILIGLLFGGYAIIYLIVSLLKVHPIVQVIKVIISFCLVFASFQIKTTVDTVSDTLDQVLTPPTEYNTYVTIITLKDSGIIAVDDLKDKRVAVQRSIDTDYMSLAMEELSKLGMNEQKNFYFYDDYAPAIKNLYDGYMSALVVSEDSLEALEETYETLAEDTSKIEAYKITLPVNILKREIDVSKNAFTILISGVGEAGSPSQREKSDSNIIAVVNPMEQSVTMISLPRDSYVPNACRSFKDDKLTHTGQDGGVDCTIKTIENYFDIEIDYYARITFTSVVNFIDALGGVEVDVPMDFCEYDSSRKYDRKNVIYLNKGLQTLNGEQALALARHRYTIGVGDIGRAYNQQLVVNAIIKKMMNPAMVGKVDSLIKIVGELTQTNFTRKEIYAFVNAFLNNPSSWELSNNVIEGEKSFETTARTPNKEMEVRLITAAEQKKVKYLVRSAKNMDLSTLYYNANEFSVNSEEDDTEVETEGETSGYAGNGSCYIHF